MSNELLASRIRNLLFDSSKFRIVIGIAGSPGGGKTTLAEQLVQILNLGDQEIAVQLPMDGYHLANATLDRLGIHDRKGAIDTFDGWGFLSLVKRLANELDHTIYAPSFRREIDEGVAGEIAIEPHHQIVIIEGNYLLADSTPWGEVRNNLDESWFCSTPHEERLRRLVERHVRFGRTQEDAERWAVEVDGVNAALIATTAINANLVVSGETGEILN